jgi:hypothetical protein
MAPMVLAPYLILPARAARQPPDHISLTALFLQLRFLRQPGSLRQRESQNGDHDQAD